MLHLTNGTSVIPLIESAGIDGQIVPWNDVLHEGPVPAGLGPAALRERRADFLASCGWGPRDDIARDLEVRDRALDDAIDEPRGDQIVLWFEHDLFDQLHLIQILDRLPVDGGPPVTIVQAATYLGRQPASNYPALFEGRRVVSSAERIAARDGWAAFRSADPRAVVDVIPRVTLLAHLGPALRRHLEQFPSLRNGLSRTEQQTLETVASGISLLRDVYASAHHDREDAIFMGDAAFLVHISSLIRSHRPLLKTHVSASARSQLTASFGETSPERPIGREGGPLHPFIPSDPRALDVQVALTTLGASVLSGESDRIELCGIDRWLGGVYLSGNGPVWRWDGERQTVRFA